MFLLRLSITIGLLLGLLYAQDEEFNIRDFIINHSELSDAGLLKQLEKNLSELDTDESDHFVGVALNSSPDKAFSIIMFQRESCGAYCNPYNEALIRFQQGDSLYYSDWAEGGWSNMNIDSVFLIDKKQSLYLILGEQWGRPRGIEGTTCKYAYLLQHKDSDLEQIWEHTACTSNLAYDEEDARQLCDLIYEPQSQVVNYTFRNYEEGEEGIIYFEESGTFVFNKDKGVFEEKIFCRRVD